MEGQGGKGGWIVFVGALEINDNVGFTAKSLDVVCRFVTGECSVSRVKTYSK